MSICWSLNRKRFMSELVMDVKKDSSHGLRRKIELSGTSIGKTDMVVFLWGGRGSAFEAIHRQSERAPPEGYV